MSRKELFIIIAIGLYGFAFCWYTLEQTRYSHSHFDHGHVIEAHPRTMLG